jgi:hypothetical protein
MPSHTWTSSRHPMVAVFVRAGPTERSLWATECRGGRHAKASMCRLRVGCSGSFRQRLKLCGSVKVLLRTCGIRVASILTVQATSTSAARVMAPDSESGSSLGARVQLELEVQLELGVQAVAFLEAAGLCTECPAWRYSVACLGTPSAVRRQHAAATRAKCHASAGRAHTRLPPSLRPFSLPAPQ